jgi:LPS export ABC transporter protein LptC
MKRRGALFSLPVLIALGVLLFWSLRGLDRARPFEAADARPAPRYELVDAQWTRTADDGTPAFTAHAAQLAWYDDQSAELHQADVSGLGGAGSPWQLQAPHGRMPAGSRDLLLYDGVTGSGRWSDGQTMALATERIWVDVEDRQLRTDSAITLSGPGRGLSATGFSADFDGEQVQLLSNVQAHYTAQPLPPADKPRAPPSTAKDAAPAAPQDGDARGP